MVRNPHRNRRIQNPADTQGRVEHETGGGAARPRRPQLEHVVDGDDWLTEIDQEMVHRLADRPRGQNVVDGGQRPDKVAIQGHLQGKANPVQAFERIVGSLGPTPGGMTRPGD